MSAETAKVSGSSPRRTRKSELTAEKILQAAEQVLREQGYAGLATREVADRAGVQLSQIHYHFGSKQGLLLALFEDLDRRLLQRQKEMYTQDLPLWRQWEIACDYLDQDLESGYVRILNELSAAGWSDPEIGEITTKTQDGWTALLTNVARRASRRFGAFAPLDPEDVAALVSSAFIGAEIHILSGRETAALPVRRALRRFGQLIRQFEERPTRGE